MSKGAKNETFWQMIHSASTDTCYEGVRAWQRWQGLPETPGAGEAQPAAAGEGT
jgi:hypothetical protein